MRLWFREEPGSPCQPGVPLAPIYRSGTTLPRLRDLFNGYQIQGGLSFTRPVDFPSVAMLPVFNIYNRFELFRYGKKYKPRFESSFQVPGSFDRVFSLLQLSGRLNGDFHFDSPSQLGL